MLLIFTPLRTEMVKESFHTHIIYISELYNLHVRDIFSALKTPAT